MAADGAGPRSTLPWKRWVWAIALFVFAALISFQAWSTWQDTRRADRLRDDLSERLAELDAESLSAARLREEIAQLREENEAQSDFWHHLVRDLGPLVAVAAAVIGAAIPFSSYLDSREKERKDRERERLDRAASELRTILDRLAADDPSAQLMGVLSLEHYFAPDKSEYHEQALSALLSLSRALKQVPGEPTDEETAELRRSIGRAVQRGIAQVSADVLAAVSLNGSWSGVSLGGVDFACLPHTAALRGVDFRDAVLDNARFVGLDLTGATFRAAWLRGAVLDRATLDHVDFGFADLAGASINDATLAGASLEGAKIQDLRLAGAELTKVAGDVAGLPWELTHDWRGARLDDGLRRDLIARLGEAPHGPRVVMLLWEISPLVAGGTWTAAYHLVRRLRQQGADVVVVVPWSESDIASDHKPFGSEVRVVPLGISADDLSGAAPELPGPYGSGPPGYAYSPYGRSTMPNAWWNPYSSTTPSPGYGWSSYASVAPPWNPYARATDPMRGRIARHSILLRMREEFAERVRRRASEFECDVVHAHDWVTFEAGRKLATELECPWVAHVHSIEIERRADDPDPVIQNLERDGIVAADRVVTPSRVTRDRVASAYGIAAERLVVVPNPISDESISYTQTGRRETRRLVFVGRLTMQKGVDRFVRIADEACARNNELTVAVFGAGEEEEELRRHGYSPEFRPWSRRSDAFAGASAIVVPSRAEPFGMVVLEAMLHRVPVLFPRDSGVAEVIDAGIVLPDGADGDEALVARAVDEIHGLMSDPVRWEAVIEQQAGAVHAYTASEDGGAILGLWRDLAQSAEVYPPSTG